MSPLALEPDADAFWMRRALAEAARGRGRVEPNPMVGAAVVRDGQLLSVGHHARFGGPHAEVEALRRVGGSSEGATLYVTLEPCCHHGKTPPCTDAVIASGIRRVVAAMRDPFPKVDGGGFARLLAAGLEVACGVGEAEARRLNAPYLTRLHAGRPFVTAKWAMTLDGKTACRTGDSRWISGERSRAAVHELRGRMDAILVGIGTALADDPELTARPPGPRTPWRIVLDREGRLPLDSRLVRTAREVPVLVAATDRIPPDRRASLESAGCEVAAFDGEGRAPIDRLLGELGRRGLTNLLIEGGSRVLGAFADADAIDAVDVYIAPKLEGGDHPFAPVRGTGRSRMSEALRLEAVAWEELDGDLRMQGMVHRPWLESAGASDSA